MIIDPNELKEDLLTILRDQHGMDRIDALKLVDDNLLERVMDRMYEAEYNELVWQMTKRGT